MKNQILIIIKYWKIKKHLPLKSKIYLLIWIKIIIIIKRKKIILQQKKKIEKELNNLIHSLLNEFYKDVVIKSKFYEIMKNIDEIKQVENKKSVMKNKKFTLKKMKRF